METGVQKVENPFEAMRQKNTTGAVVVESNRAVAEAVAAMQIARANPRDPVHATDMILTDCSLPALAEDAVYEYARGGSDISGPSIRLAETIARRWGNIRMGVAEIARRDGFSEVKAYAIDLETGTTDEKLFQVRHWRDKKNGGGYALTDERDIYETIANQGARRKRACILTVIPQDVIDAAVKQCEVTMKAKVEITPDFINSLLESFGKIGVTQEMLEKRIQRRLDALTPALAVQLRKIKTSVSDGMSTIEQWFEVAAAVGGAVAQTTTQQTGAPAGASERMAQELAARKAAKEPQKEPEPSKEPLPLQTVLNAAAPASIAEALSEETGEITHEFVEKKIGELTTQEALQAILMGDIMRLPPGPRRDATMGVWNRRVMALRGVRDVAPPAEKAKPAPATSTSRQPPKPHGTTEIKAKIIAAMNKAAGPDALNEAADQITLYAWDASDKSDMEARYAKCKEDLEL